MSVKIFLTVLVLVSVVTVVFIIVSDSEEKRLRVYDYNHEVLYRLPSGEATRQTDFPGQRRDIFPSKDVLVRSVYFDGRKRDGHNNVSVFLVLVRKNITDNNLISGCQVGQKRAKHFKVKLIGETGLWRVYPQYNVIDHEEALIHCYDLPATDGEEAYLYYKTSKKSKNELAVRAERPFMVPRPYVQSTLKEGHQYGFSVLTCTKVFGNPTFLKEWLTYQLTIGIDHVHMVADESFFRSISKDLSHHLKQLMDSGFLSIDFWVAWLVNGKEVWYHNQGLIIEDCIYQFRGTYDYVFILDTDDFFVPRVPNEKKVQYYINKECGKADIGNCKFKWVEFYPDRYGMNTELSIDDGNITRQLRSFDHRMQGNRKSVHRINAIVDSATHYAYDVIPGYKRVEYPEKLAYVGHVRKYMNPDMNHIVTGLP